MRRRFVFEVRINQSTEANCNRWLGLCCELYNLALEQKRIIHKQYRKTVSLYDQILQLPALKQTYPEFQDIDAQCLRSPLKRLDHAYKAFFRRLKARNGKAGFPRFKSKFRYNSFTLEQSGWKLQGKYLYIRNVGKFKLFLSRPIQGRIKTVTIIRKPTGKWFVSFSCDEVPERTFPTTDKEVGIDVGIKSFCVDSDGKQIPNPKFLQQSEQELKRKQRFLSRKKRGSNRRQKAKTQVAKVYATITNQRKDFLHKLANSYIQAYQTIYVEGLQIHNMVRNKHLSKSINDSCWGLFFTMLSYKAAETGRQVVKVNPYNTTQLCSCCGEKVPKSLAVRIHKCPACGLELDRDHNAALNILNQGRADPSGVKHPIGCLSENFMER